MINVLYAIVLIGVAFAAFIASAAIGMLMVPIFLIAIVAVVVGVIREDLKGD